MEKPRYDTSKVFTGLDLRSHTYDTRDYVRPGFALGTVGSLVAAGGSGKTFKATQDAVAIACGRDSIKRGAVLYLPAEDPLDEIGVRLQSIIRAYQLTDDELTAIDKNLIFWPLLGAAPDLIEQDDEGGLVLLKSVCEIAEDLPNLRLIVFDTLRRFSYLDENNGGDMSRVLAVLEQMAKGLGCSCLFLHHVSKSSAIQGQVSAQQSARGSSVLVDNIRYQEFLQGMTQDYAEEHGEVDSAGNVPHKIGDERKRYVLWGVSKQNYGKPVADQWYKKNEDGVLLPVQIGRVGHRKGNSGRLM